MITLIQCPKSHFTKTLKWEKWSWWSSFYDTCIITGSWSANNEGGILMAMNLLTHSGKLKPCCY